MRALRRRRSVLASRAPRFLHRTHFSRIVPFGSSDHYPREKGEANRRSIQENADGVDTNSAHLQAAKESRSEHQQRIALLEQSQQTQQRLLNSLLWAAWTMAGTLIIALLGGVITVIANVL